MKNQELFDRTIAILVKAYMNNTLESGNACGCAVGNLVASSYGYKLEKDPKGHFHWIDSGGDMIQPQWNNLFYTSSMTFLGIKIWSSSHFEDEEMTSGIKPETQKTGYTVIDLSKIESSFEKGQIGFTKSKRMFNGLMSVVDCLMQIHEATVEEANEAKLLFVK